MTTFFFLAGLALWIISAVTFFLAIILCVHRCKDF